MPNENLEARMVDKMNWDGFALAITEEGANRVASSAASLGAEVQTNVSSEAGAVLPEVVTIKLHGPLVTAQVYDDLTKAVNAAAESPTVKEIVIDFNSPGGSIVGLYAAARNIRRVAGLKTVTAHVTGECSSAAYWLAAACSQISACPTSVVGGIGVMIAMAEAKPELLPVSVTKIVSTSTPFKANAASTESGKEQYQAVIDAQCAVFFDELSGFRGVSRAIIESKYGAGRVLGAQAALACGMIDRIDGEVEMADKNEEKIPVNGEALPPVEEKKDAELNAPAESKAEDAPTPDADRVKVLEAELAMLKQQLAALMAAKELEAAEAKAQASTLKMAAVIEPLLAAGLITPAERAKAEQAFQAQAENPSMTWFDDVYASRTKPVVMLDTRASSGAQAASQSTDPRVNFMIEVESYCAAHSIDPEGPDYARAVLAVQNGNK